MYAWIRLTRVFLLGRISRVTLITTLDSCHVVFFAREKPKDVRRDDTNWKNAANDAANEMRPRIQIRKLN